MDWIADPAVNQFLDEVRELGLIWTLMDEEGYLLNGTRDGDSRTFPVWSDMEKAMRFAVGDWESKEPACVDIGEFLSVWVAMNLEDGVSFDVNSTPDSLGPIVKPEVFLRLLGKEI